MEAKKATISMLFPAHVVQQACVWFCFQEWSSAAETMRMKFVFKDKYYSRCSIFRWHKEFAQGHQKLGDFMRSGAPRKARTPAKIQQCKNLVTQNRWMGIHQLSNQLSISYGTTSTILHKDLGLDKKVAKLVPHLLMDRDKQKRIEFCSNFISVYGANPRGLYWILTTDESWFYLCDLRSKVETIAWLVKGEECPQVVRREMSVKKCMFIPFLDSKGLVHFEFFENQTVNKEVFLHLLLRVHDSV